MSAPFSRFGRILAAAVCLAFLAAPAIAHPRPWRHHHRRVRAHAVIVIGTPRPLRRVVIVDGRPGAVVDFNVKPKSSRIWVDGTYRGTADEFDGFPRKMHLRPGRHVVRIVTPDGVDVRREVVLAAGTEVDVNLDLR